MSCCEPQPLFFPFCFGPITDVSAGDPVKLIKFLWSTSFPLPCPIITSKNPFSTQHPTHTHTTLITWWGRHYLRYSRQRPQYPMIHITNTNTMIHLMILDWITVAFLFENWWTLWGIGVSPIIFIPLIVICGKCVSNGGDLVVIIANDRWWWLLLLLVVVVLWGGITWVVWWWWIVEWWLIIGVCWWVACHDGGSIVCWGFSCDYHIYNKSWPIVSYISTLRTIQFL